jgi:membrane-anchored protein YejM (alkaline phosphatase superfamily)
MNDNDEVYEERMKEAAAMQTEKANQEDDLEWQEPAATRKSVENGPLPLLWLKSEEIDELQSRWNSIQIEFVDDPRASVKQADELVAEALERIEQAFSNQRTVIDEQWINPEDVSTEDLRIALQSYRSFLNRLLTI